MQSRRSTPQRADRIATAWREGERAAATEAVSDEMLTDLGVAGTPDDARDQLRTLVSETGIDHPIVVVPEPASNAVTEATIDALAPTQL